jgi:hypothetical protein
MIFMSGYAGAYRRPAAVPRDVRQGGGHLPHLAVSLQAAAQPRHAGHQVHQGGDVSQVVCIECRAQCSTRERL